ncbi:tyrosine-type recombinase/integrase [Georgenia sp. AZ-5]|uniref:tyrosine-type recombinase/integrase n=1 Tax=Georgenia sp. AZ-5 TaxID=3367526 RepID=UPI0037548BA3
MKRSDGSVAYKVLYRHNGKQTSATFDNPQARTHFLRNLDAFGPDVAVEILDSSHPDEAPLTLTQYARKHVANLSGIGEATRERYGAFIRRDLARIDLPLDAITPAVVAGWVNGLERAGASGKTIKNKHGFLSGVLEGAVRDGHLSANPCKHTRLPRTLQRDEMTFLTPGEFAVLADAVPAYWRPLVTTLVGTGLRVSEATALQVQDVDLDNGTVRVVRAWKRATDGTGWRLGPPKSKKSRRTVALSTQVRDLLVPLVDGRAPGEFLFTNRAGRPVRLNTWFKGVWQPALKRAHLGKPLRIHDLRHTCASWLIAGGLDLLTVQYTLGHESLTTTSDRYGHLMPERRQAAAAVMTMALAQAFPEIEPPRAVIAS